MAELIVINTGPLISLSRAELLETVGRLPLDFICPAERVTGALGLLARAKELGIIPALRPATEKLRQEGAFYSDDLVDEILGGVGEV